MRLWPDPQGCGRHRSEAPPAPGDWGIRGPDGGQVLTHINRMKHAFGGQASVLRTANTPNAHPLCGPAASNKTAALFVQRPLYVT